MAREMEQARPFKPWFHLRESVDSLLMEREYRIVIGWSAFFFVLTFLLYWFLGPKDTIFINHINQANSFLHGRLDLVPELSGYITEPAIKDDKLYLQHPLGPAILLVPWVAVFGLDTNQTLVSVLAGAITAPVIFAITRRFTESLTTQIWLTVLFLFGTIFWFTASNGGVWFFSHTVAMLFLFLAIYVTLTSRNPFLIGLFLGAAYLSRQSMILAFPFFLIMLSGDWLLKDSGQSLLKRVSIKPLAQLASGAGIFLLISFVLNYLRFSNPLESGYSFSEQVHQEELAWLFNRGVLHITYIPRHIPVFFEGLPIFRSEGPYILPSWAGMAIWGTTPVFLYGLFVGIRDRRVIAIGGFLLFAAIAIIISRGVAGAFDLGWEDFDFILDVHLLPFYGMIALAIVTGLRNRNKLVIACWAAIIPIALTNFSFAATGWTQFGYRYGQDFYPFLFLLIVMAIAGGIKWHHKALIVASIAVNLWGVLWIYQFEARGFLGLEWVTF